MTETQAVSSALMGAIHPISEHRHSDFERGVKKIAGALLDLVKERLVDPPSAENEATKRLRHSVCRIESYDSKGARAGNGVFILPDVVATAWHVLQSARDVVFINEEGEEARLLRGGIRKFHQKLDLAVVELDRSLCRQPVHYGDTDDYLEDMKGTLVTRFSGAATFHKIGLDKGRVLMDWAVNNNGMNRNFLCDQRIGPGYSGSPIFDSRGRVCSIVTAGQWTSLSDYERDGRFSHHAAGPAPYRFGGFIRQQLDI